jgi:hypothetical protein
LLCPLKNFKERIKNEGNKVTEVIIMKGFSLTTETVVVIILAAVVLGIIILFFKGTAGPGVDEIKLEQELAKLCSDYQVLDPDCDGKVAESDKSENTRIRTEIEKTCKKLNINIRRESKTQKPIGLIHDCCKFVCP